MLIKTKKKNKTEIIWIIPFMWSGKKAIPIFKFIFNIRVGKPIKNWIYTGM